MTDGEQRPPGDSFLARRARLKADRQRAAREPEPPPERETEPVSGTSAPAPALTDADMPPVETLTAESDFSQFLAEGVSDVLRRAALRKLFHLPEFNILDGLNDYDEDYTTFEKLGDLMTYQKRRLLAREEAVEKETDRALDSTGSEEAATLQGDTAGEVTVARDGEEAADSRTTIAAADGDEVEDDGDLDA